MVTFARNPHIDDALTVETTVEHEILSWWNRLFSSVKVPSLRQLQQQFPTLNLKCKTYTLFYDETTYCHLTISPAPGVCPEHELAAFIALIETLEQEKMQLRRDKEQQRITEQHQREARLDSLERCINRVRQQ